MVMMPWDDIESAFSRGNYYGLHPHNGHPFAGAPITEAAGGTVYFDADCKQESVDALLRLMEVRTQLTDYAAFVQQSSAIEDRYLTQMRLISGGALEFLYHTPYNDEAKPLREQSLPLAEAIWKFIDFYRTEYNEGRYSIDGALGGDGDWAKERLCFGFMVENSYHAIYRIWTRAWLITK
jgi:hypothetical protein